jgi:NitT/TauT family transport system permease protein
MALPTVTRSGVPPTGRASTRTATPRQTPRRRRPVALWLLRFVSLAGAVLLWQYLTTADVQAWLRFDKLPSATEVIDRWQDQAGTATYRNDLKWSLIRIGSGFTIAAVAGVAAGIALARSRVLDAVIGTWFEVVRPIPAIALVPVAILLFPSSEQGIIFITAAAAFFPVLVSTRHAVRALPLVWEDAVKTMGASRWRVLRSIVLPGALPGIFGGLSVAIGVSWICVISAEMISGQYGVGYRTWKAYTVIDYPGVVVGMITIGLLGWLTATGLEMAGRRATRWLPREESRTRRRSA